MVEWVREGSSTMRARAMGAAALGLALSGCVVANDAPAAAPATPATSASASPEPSVTPTSSEPPASPTVENTETPAATVAPEALVGVWRTGWGGYLEFNEDGTWGASYTASGDPFDYGSYTFDGRSLTITTEGGSAINKCEVGDSGTYQVTFSEQETKIVFSREARDTCSERGRDMPDPDGLTRREPQD